MKTTEKGIDLNKLLKKRVDRKSTVGSINSLSEFLNKDISLFSKSFGDKGKEKFYSDLYTLLSSGLDFKSAFDLIEKEEKNNDIRKILTEVKAKVINGVSLSESLFLSGKFSDYEIYSVKIGEETGKLYHVLNDLAEYFKRKIKQKRQLTSALSYPVIVLSTVVGVMVFMMKVMVPMFEDMFKRFKGELPPVTRFVIALSNTIGSSFSLFVILIVSLGVFFYFQKDKIWYRQYLSSFLLKIPGIGILVQRIYLGRFCHSMNLLLSSSIPLVNALGMIKKMIRYYPIESSIDKICSDITRGKSFHESLSDSKIYTDRMISLIKVGEEVNQLDKMFERLNVLFIEEVEHQTTVLKSLLEPVLILFLGLVVGFILVAMYLPIFQLSTSVGK